MKPEIELHYLKQQIKSRSRDVVYDDCLWGENRARYYELVNAKRAEAGKPPLENDEAANPEFAVIRRHRLAEAELAHNILIEIWPADSSFQDALDEIDRQQLSARKAGL